MTHPAVEGLAAQVQAVADHLAGQITYATEPAATAVMMCFLAKLRGAHASAENVPLEDLVTCDSLPYWREVFDRDELRAARVNALRHFQVPIPRVRPQQDGSLGIQLNWIHPDQDEPLLVDAPRKMRSAMAYLERNDVGEWRVGRIHDPA